ncbi:hypothetical protein [Sphingomonas montana]|uniref:hypothetical protein n=1 Tax=Sphingomonas montana TaxID=1843236 RepID=UPI00096CC0F4|nr:hypothetical protein [Sphingomonas montana]
MPINDNGPTDTGSDPGPAMSATDGPGMAALLLVESLIHGLRENAMLTNDEVISIVQTAIDVQYERAEAADEGAAPVMWRSYSLLTEIGASLRIDGYGQPTLVRPV